jgi:hypothetical protein
MISTEDILRIEHKLDVLINYLHGMTNVRPAPVPKPIDGFNGLTDGICPITGSPITIQVDTATGRYVRRDGLLSGLPRIAGAIPAPPVWDSRDRQVEP